MIDVNTGKNVGTPNLEETVFRNNLEAAEEIARQLRLRDIGGIIVIDFIDMEIRDEPGARSRRRCARARPGTRPAPGRSTSRELGLVEMTRKRVGEGLLEAFARPARCAKGAGSSSPETRSEPGRHRHLIAHRRSRSGDPGPLATMAASCTQ